MRTTSILRQATFGLLLCHVCQEAAATNAVVRFIEEIPRNVLIIIGAIVLSTVWLGCTYFITSRHQKALQYLQRQLDELWLVQAKPSVWPHTPFIPNPRDKDDNPPEYIPPKNPQENAQGKLDNSQ
ncbi:uncharacterized protein [Drosophila pseudoobscura]|uniref:Uncharacterized protein n=1 Tax=Drosophila pseudoobscura pseudoobscura TaxID=46245 RepID=A0A6I8UM28_DROPS|nr:uncharacterized protein LOC4800326 [Drosophila pseudoobscura]